MRRMERRREEGEGGEEARRGEEREREEGEREGEGAGGEWMDVYIPNVNIDHIYLP